MAISRLAAKKILKDAGATRISDDAISYFAEALNIFAYSIAKKAVKLAAHAKRKTVEKEDIKLAEA
ncbi:MAG: histone [Candidatus Micrarchaeia archaeon]